MDTVLSSVNSYTYQNSEAQNMIDNFSIKAIDSCGNSRVRSLVHNSILLTNTADACDYSISLNWNDYINASLQNFQERERELNIWMHHINKNPN